MAARGVIASAEAFGQASLRNIRQANSTQEKPCHNTVQQGEVSAPYTLRATMFIT